MSSESPFEFNTIESAIEDIRAGKMVIVVDDEDRENEGDFVMAAEKVTPESINQMVTYGRGLVCVPLTRQRAYELNLEPMVVNNTDSMETAFTVSVDHRPDTTTGISASDRAKTIQALVNADASPTDFRRPGHIFPLISREGGVLRRAGHTEAAIDLAKLAGCKPAGVICEIMNDDGTMARLDDLIEVARRFDMKLITINDLISYRMKHESLVREAINISMPTIYGDFRLHAFEEKLTGAVHLALAKGSWEEDDPILVRVHSLCMTGDVFGSKRCDCGEQLHTALRMVEEEGAGVVLYMNQEGRGIGLINKLHAYKLQEEGMDTIEANEALGFKSDLRDYGVGAQMLRSLGVSKMRLMTNNPAKRVGLVGYGLEIVERVPIETESFPENLKYLRTKRDKMGHDLQNIDPHDQLDMLKSILH
ncbi:bifunctional 3,4-dihydroxy-2-butanone-4-phosphate synthase/GTP cyclohydrolase II [Natronogracilivirga saccharolytica]|uniref:Riboflavin biosynthesis protein RibBA n=1 Tax=Natronogracilivirga saccharolytica TaxID=2812953 RepID=A0A8J7UTM1_9BACT|nr:bifunctional 3,4-dihydroxy-2-butanone-4-phosphate synthase/GTP cyclohydrolase II [Natronogracilivirga saccharolytica]MBP3192741.1 bifunctional 3,4-dihydroxy-2-butanone-4-phosphate synthase/GTP cyclohydrolase II [Natronogracilivirga saccharolytica]